MSPNNKFPSKRAKRLVALCENYNDRSYSSTPSESPISSCFTMSPVSAWWDNIFEACDIPKSVKFTAECCHMNRAKRKLSFSPEKERNSTPTIKPCTPPAIEFQLTCSVRNKSEYKLQSDQLCPPSVHDLETGPRNKYSDVLTSPGTNEATNKLQLYPSQIKIMAAKLALNSGKEHVTTAGKLRKARTLKPACKESCKRCEAPNLNLNERQKIHDMFWELKDHVKQWNFIHSSITCTAPKKSAVGALKRKHFNRLYRFTICGKPRRVCKTMFISTLSICDSWIDSALSHCVDNEMTCDKRGKKSHLNR